MTKSELFADAIKIEVEIYNALKTVIDPELGINIIDIGLVYKIEYTEELGISIEYTLSTKNCPMGDAIMNDVKNAIQEKFPDKKKNIQLVWEPAWSTDFVTADGRKELGMD